MVGLTAPQMEYEAKVVYESLASADAPGYTSRQWSILLTQAQEKLVLEVIKQGFDNDEINRRKIHSLLRQGVEAEIIQDSHIPFGYRVKFPSRYLHIVKDSASVKGSAIPVRKQLNIWYKPSEVPTSQTQFGTITFTKENHPPVTYDLGSIWAAGFIDGVVATFNQNKPFGTINADSDYEHRIFNNSDGVMEVRIAIRFSDRYSDFNMELNPAEGIAMGQIHRQDFEPLHDLTRIKPISYDFYHRNIENPFEKPYKGEFWRLVDSEGAVIITDGRPLNNYIVTYIERPSPIITSELTANTAIEGIHTVTNCQLDPMLHRDIVYTAARLAVTYTGDSNNYQLHSIEGQR